MKKLMMFIIALIPLMLIFTIQLTTTYIENSHYIAVEKVQFAENYQIINKTDDNNVVLNFPARVVPVSATNKEIVYISSNESIATVDADGKITFYDFGNVTIVAKSKATESIYDSCTFFITDDKAHRLKITHKQSELLLGGHFYIGAVVIPSEALNKSLTYSSSNPNAIIVMPDGRVTAVGEGESVITVSTVNGKTDSFSVKTIIPVQKIEIPENMRSLVTGVNTCDFPQIIVTPSNSTNKNVTYSSSNPDVATISNTGEITFNVKGEVTFTATSVDGGHTVNYKVLYTGGYFISMEVNKDYKTINLNYEDNKVVDLELDVYPLNADLKNIRYASTNPSVVNVIENELVVKGGGTTVINVYANTGSGEISSQCVINVKRDAEQIVAENVITENSEFVLNYVVNPSDHTNEVLLGVGSNLATINNGIIEFKAPGSVVVTISTNNGLSKNIVVTYAPKNLDIKTITSPNHQITDLSFSDEFNLSFDVGLNMGKPSYSGYDSDILYFNEATNTFTAIDGGTTTIVATDGVVTCSVTVTIYRKVTQISCSLSNPDSDANLVVTDGKVVTGLKKIKLLSSTYPETATITVPTITVENYSQELLLNNKNLKYSNAILNDIDKIAEINKNFELVFNKAGTVKVTLSADGVSVYYIITSTYGSVTKVVVDNAYKTINLTYNEEENYFVNFVYSISPLDADLNNITLSVVSGSSVVIENKKIKVVSGGQSIVKISGDVQGSEDTFVVDVLQNIDSIHIEDNNNTVNISESDYQIKYSAVPNTHTNNIKFESNSSIASVNNTGYVTFNAPGKIVVTVSSEQSCVFNTIEILYTPASVTKTITSNNSNVNVNYLENFAFIFDLENAMGVPTYSGYNTSVVEFDAESQTFTAVQGGSTVIVATDGTTTIIINLTVIKKVSDIQFDLFEFDNLENKFELKQTGTDYSVTTAVSKFKLTTRTLDEYATIKTPILVLDNAYLQYANITTDGTIEFSKAGTIKIVLSADAITKTLTITSTYGYMLSVNAITKNYTYDYDLLDNKIIQVDFKVSPADANMQYVSFESSNSSTIKIEDGKLVIAGGGVAIITIKAKINETEFVYDTCTISVSQNATSLAIDGVNNGVLNISTSEHQIVTSVLPLTQTNTLTYAVSSNIASVTSTGKIVFNSPGKVTLTVSANQNVKQSIVVCYIPENFNNYIVSDINSTINVNYGDVFGLIFDINLNFGLPNFSGFNNDILQYNQTTFKFTALKGGTTTIVAIDGTTNVNIIVNVYRKVDSISANVTYSDSQNSPILDANNVYITSLTELKINATISPNHATVKNAQFEIISGADVASVNESGKVLFKKYGIVEIRVYAENVSQVIKLKSTFNKAESFELYNVTISNDVTVPSLILDDLGVTYTLVLNSFIPTDYVYNANHFTFKTTNAQVASVNSNGVISAVGKGTTTITVEVKLTDTLFVTKSFVVEVKVKTSDVVFNYNGNNITEGKIINNAIVLGYDLLPESPNTPNNQNVKIEVVSQNANHETIATISNINSTTKTFTLSFDNSVLDGVAYVRVSTEDSDYVVCKEIAITKISSVEALSVKFADVNVVGLTVYSDYTVKEQFVTVEPSVSDLLDSINLSNLIASSSNGENVKVESVLQDGKHVGIFKVYKTDNLNKSVAETITFGYGSTTVGTTACVTFKFYDIAIELDINKENHLLGLQRKHVFGTSRYYTTDGTNYTHSNNLPVEYTKIVLSGKDATLNTDTLYWQTSNSNVATISTSANGEVLLNFTPSNVTAETQLTVYVSLEPLTANGANYNQIHNSVKSAFTYNIVNGCNIYDNAGYRYCVTKYPMVINNNIDLKFEISGTDYSITQSSSILGKKYKVFATFPSYHIYGNGFTLNYNNLFAIKGNGSEEKPHEIQYPAGITNVVIKGANDSASKTNYKLTICFNNSTNSYCRIKNYGKIWIGTANGKVYFKNCIFENCTTSGIQMGRDGADTYSVYLENTLFYETGQLAIEQQAGKLYIKGIFEVYNFASSSEFDSTYRSVINSMFNKFGSDKVYTDSSGTKYANTCIGLLPSLTANISSDDKLYFYDDTLQNYVEYGFGDATTDAQINEKNKVGVEKTTYLTKNVWVIYRPTKYAELNVLPEEVINSIYAPTP